MPDSNMPQWHSVERLPAEMQSYKRQLPSLANI